MGFGGQESGDIRVFNPNKEISREITLEILIRHRDAMKQARTGELIGATVEQIKDNARKYNQVRALNLIISAQREMITISRPIVYFRSQQKWKKANKSDEDKKDHPFEEENNDPSNMKYEYFKIMYWLEFLKHCEEAILSAERTRTLDDDFVRIANTGDGQRVSLTDSFYEMLEDLEAAYEQIYLLMLINKIVSAGIEEDEEMSYKEQEDEAVRRVVEA